MLFAFKKYVPKDKTRIDEHYERFVEEIKILFKTAHPNIVRIFNYYLYPNQKTGYLQMEYIEGDTINQYKENVINKKWDDIFLDCISAFVYLENNKILHRDIRPENILIDKNGIVKIIDFGFGKIINEKTPEENSVILNWPVTEMPEEIMRAGEYDNVTEIYFLGKLFHKLLENGSIRKDEFKFEPIINKMIEIEREKRFSSFEEIQKEIAEKKFEELKYSDKELKIYRDFSDELYNNIRYFHSPMLVEKDPDIIKIMLESVLYKNALEEYIQKNNDLINCFLKNGYNYTNASTIEVSIVKDFYELFNKISRKKKENILENLYNKLSRINVKVKDDDDDLPF